jgi:hypothetical protein
MTDKQDHVKRSVKPATGDMAAIFAALEKITHRLDRLERSRSIATELGSPHPSEERFAVAEAVAEDIFDRLNKEKTCTFEPNGRACDHCAMCSSRGF